MSSKGGDSRQVEELAFPIYYQADRWVSLPAATPHTVTVLGTRSGAGLTGTKWHVDGITIDPPLPHHPGSVKPTQWNSIAPLIEQGIRNATDREPTGLFPHKMEKRRDG